MFIDITSDVHVDFWVNNLLPKNKQIKLLATLIEKLLPPEPSETLIIAGDIGHYNKQDVLFFEILKNYYKKIIWTHGNHDLYMVSHNIQQKYHYNSFNRLNEKIELINKIPGVYYLDGSKPLEFDGFKIGGCGMWYNNDYAKQVWNKTDVECIDMWNWCLNDSKCINIDKKQINYLKYFQEQYELLKNIYLECNVIVTHVSPTWQNIPEKYKIVESTFFHFDGSELLKNINKDTLWIFGHTHDKHHFVHRESGCTFVCNPLDYGHENWIYDDLDRKFVTMSVGKQPSYEEIFKDCD
jgi:predicted phosphodiesterase